VGPSEGVKPRLSQALTRGACPDLNSRLAVQISNPLSSCYVLWRLLPVIPSGHSFFLNITRIIY